MPELWGMTPEGLAAVQETWRRGPHADRGADRLLPRPNPGPRGADRVVVIPIVGPLAHRRSWWGTALDAIAAQVTEAAAAGRPIVLDIDSPGGEVLGTPEAADAIADAARRVPVVAAVQRAASAAYWLASQAGAIVVTPSGELGAIGVILAHLDWSRSLDAAGVTPTLIAVPAFKTEGHPWQPLSAASQAAWRRDVERVYARFVATVARGRRLPVATVAGPAFGEGRLVDAETAVRVGAADALGTLGDVVRDLAAGRWTPTRPALSARAARVRLLALGPPPPGR